MELPPSGEELVGAEKLLQAADRTVGRPAFPCAHLFQRREDKYELGAAVSAGIRSEIAGYLPLFEYHKGNPYTHITTLYFDTKNRDFYRLAERNYNDNIKIRVKEYYYAPLAPSGSASPRATSRPDGVDGREPEGAPAYLTCPQCYVELKQSVNGTVLKKRFALLKRDLHLLFSGQDVWPNLVQQSHPSERGPLREIYRELQRYITLFPVEVTSVVNYRRTVYQKDENDLRVTFDDHLAVYPPRSGLYTDQEAFTAEVLGKPIRTSERVILEIKCPGEYPSWLKKILQAHSSKRLSKFMTSVRLILGCSADAQGLERPKEGVHPPPGLS
jgi:hypothetical protein